MEAQTPAGVVIERRVEWSDTDAAGHYHFSAVLRWAEAAEAVLLRRLGLEHLFGSTPRVHFEADFHQRLWFGETVTVDLRVAKVGTTSLHYAFEVRGSEGVAATGAMAIVHSAVAPRGTGPAGSASPAGSESPAGAPASQPWPDDVREALAHAGPQRPETYSGG